MVFGPVLISMSPHNIIRIDKNGNFRIKRILKRSIPTQIFLDVLLLLCRIGKNGNFRIKRILKRSLPTQIFFEA